MEFAMRSKSLLLLLLVAVSVTGCSNGPDPNEVISAKFDNNFKRLATLYSTFQARHNWTGPTDESEFRKYISEINPKHLSRMGIDQSSVDGLFQSERDKKPLRIRWSVTGGNGVPPRPILFETTGVEGKLMVVFTNSTSKEFSKSDYDKLWNGEGDDGSMMGQKAQSGRPDAAQSP